MKLPLAFTLALLTSLIFPSRSSLAADVTVDICIYGGTSGGIAAAIAAKRDGKSVVVIEPSRHIGGLSAGGLGVTDFGNKQVIGGFSRSFYKRIGKHYNETETWNFEPHIAEKAFNDWLEENDIRVILEHRLASLIKKNSRIREITLEKAPPMHDGATAANALPGLALTVEAKMFIDASYEGDLLAAAGVSYTVGRESSRQYDEPLNGIRAQTPKHQFLIPVDPFLIPGDPTSGLLPLIQHGDGGTPGDGDHRVQTYNFRLCLTQNRHNQLPIKPTLDYDSARYEILARHLENLAKINQTPKLGDLLSIHMVPNGKTDMNNNGAVSTDYIGMNYEYPDGSWATRSRIWREHLVYTRNLLHFLATAPRVPQSIRDEMSQWALSKDEFTGTGGWPHQMYIREARRMVGRYVITQNNCEHKRTVDDTVGMGAYNMDSHNCQRIVQNGVVRNEGDVQVGPKGPYLIPYRAITPKADECHNLLAPVCFSASHIAYGSARMEPVFMVLGESAATAASIAIDSAKPVQEVDIPTLQKKLRDNGQVLALEMQKQGGDMTFISNSPYETEQIAADLAARLPPGRCIALHGELGAGKTQFARGLVLGLGGQGRTVSSPTFVLLNVYDTPRMKVYHLDAYRITTEQDFESIGFPELLEQQGLVIVEWPERITGLLPTDTLHIHLTAESKTRRKIEIFGVPPSGGLASPNSR